MVKPHFIFLPKFVLTLALTGCAGRDVEICSAAALAHRTAELEQCKTQACEDAARDALSRDLDRCDR